MLLDPNLIETPQLLAGLLRNFGIELKKNPPFPISLQGLVNFLAAEGVDAETVNKVLTFLSTNANLFAPVGRERVQAHMWPNPTKSSRRVEDELFWAKRHPIVTRKSKIVSLGSCFAINLAKWLQQNGYNYLVKEATYSERRGAYESSARWGTIYNTIGFYQVVNWAFGLDRPPTVAYRVGHRIHDPFREDVYYEESDIPHLPRLWQEHTECSRAALSEADIIVLTVGLNEVFRYLPTGHYLHRTPWGMNPALWEPRILTVDDNFNVLKTAIERVRSFNPNVKFIISVSPVPLNRSFRRDVHVATATGHSKAVLRVAIEQLCGAVPGVFYMSSFETVMYPGNTGIAWRDDERHVSSEIVDKVMRLFQQQFCGVGDGLIAARSLVPQSPAVANPFFETDHKIISTAVKECVKRGVMEPSQALDMINYCTPALYKEEYDPKAFELIRAQSIKSRFNFNNLCRAQYRENFQTSFAETPRSGAIYKGLSEEGYHVLDPTVESRKYAADLLKYLEPIHVEREVDGKLGSLTDLIAEDMPGAFRFNVPDEEIPIAPVVKLLEDHGVLRAIADDQGHPILRRVSIRYSTRPGNFTAEDERKAALQFHADNNNPTGWTKVFIYLTDVAEENGPHVFVPRSHLERPADIARDGRFTDDEVERHFGPARVLTGSAGTIIVENTQGLHKGLTIRSGVRAVLTLECVTSLLGYRTGYHACPDKVLSELSQYDGRFLHRYLRDRAKLQAGEVPTATRDD